MTGAAASRMPFRAAQTPCAAQRFLSSSGLVFRSWRDNQLIVNLRHLLDR
jgi:hypothetical protein